MSGIGITRRSEQSRLCRGRNNIDLLFFHRGLNCLVAIELKVDRFEPEHLGKLNFYLEALDRDVRKPHENPAIGVLLCASKDSEVVEYALSRALSPALVAQYQTQLPDKKLLAAKLHEFYNLNAPQAELHQPLTKPRAKKFGKTRWPGASSACNRLRLGAVGRYQRLNDSPRRNLPFVVLQGDRPPHLQQRPLNSESQTSCRTTPPRQRDRLFATRSRHPLSRSRRPEAASRTPPQSPTRGPAAEGTPRRAAIKAIEARGTA
jgi:hypothetical protein